MSKAKTLFTVALLILLGSMGAAQAQEVTTFELFTNQEKYAREGGKAEEAGTVFLTASTSNVAITTDKITLYFSAPLMEGLSAMDLTIRGFGPDMPTDSDVVLMATNDDNDKNGTIEITDGFQSGGTMSIEGVLLDVSKASGPVTVMVAIEAKENNVVLLKGPNIRNVIETIQLGVKATAKPATVRTRGTGSGDETKMATFTFEEGFKGAFEPGTELEFEVADLPHGIKVDIATMVEQDNDEATPTRDVLVDSTTLTGDAGEDQSTKLTLGNAEREVNTQPMKVTLTLTLTADASEEVMGLTYPIDIGEITATITLSGDRFVDASTASMAIFEIRPAQCTMLFPVVTVLAPWDTAISITNPGYGEEAADGGLEFTFYGMDSEPVMYKTSPSTPGSGLEANGTLAAGGTYQVMVSQVLAESGWGETFRGHVHVTADYTGCTGLGWVTDYEGVNQAYLAVVLDEDTGKGDD